MLFIGELVKKTTTLQNTLIQCINVNIQLNQFLFIGKPSIMTHGLIYFYPFTCININFELKISAIKTYELSSKDQLYRKWQRSRAISPKITENLKVIMYIPKLAQT